MTWTLGNSQSSAGVLATPATSCTLTAPTGISDGDLLVALVACDISAGGDPGQAAISGFTVPTNGSKYEAAIFQGSIRLTLLYKIASSESGNYTASWASSAAPAWAIARFTGNATSTPVDGSDGATSTTDGVITAPALSGLANTDDLLVTAFAQVGGQNPYTMPAGATTVCNNNQSNTDSVFLGMSYLALSANSSSSQTVSAAGGAPGAGVSVAFKSSAGGGGGGGGGTDDPACRMNNNQMLFGLV